MTPSIQRMNCVTNKGWGHSCYLRVLDLARDAGVSQLALFHHDPEHSDDFVDGLVNLCREEIRQKGLTFSCFGSCEGQEVSI